MTGESTEGRIVPRTHLQRRLGVAMLYVFLADVVAIVAASALGWQMRYSIHNLASDVRLTTERGGWQPHIATWLISIWVLVLLAVGSYDTRGFGARFDEFRRLVIGTMIALGLTGFLVFMLKATVPRGYVLFTFVFGLPILLLLRYIDRKVLHWKRRRGRLVSRTIAVGNPDSVAELVEVLDRENWTGYQVLGMCGHEAPHGVQLLGSVADLPEVALATGADAVLVAGGSYNSAAELRRIGWALEGLGLDMLVVPSLIDVAGPRVRFSHVAGLPLVHVQEPQIDEAMGFAKRIFDLVCASLLLLIGAIPMLIVAAIIKLQDGGPVLYSQRRVGRQQSEFQMHKFRSMVPNADLVRVDLDNANEHDGVLFKIKDDPRVTAFGRFIRKFSIDETPQLFNVLRGEMSLVGPRPPLPDEVAKYDEDVHRRLLVRPGMTGLWQVSGRSDLSWSESIRLDLYYVDNWSLTSDFV
ncbi:MAG TPA: sugar transferase, partial [Marmoricola sp.]|nr:sugar transferase [Marmoricola sp.]